MFKGLKRILGGGGGDDAKPRIDVTPARALTTIVVPQSVLDQRAETPAAVVGAVVDFVNAMFEQGAFVSTELPAPAMMAYHCDYYLSQVKNGGHSQFLHNLGPRRAAVLKDVDAGLQAMGATRHHAILAGLQAWIELNPDEVDGQTGFDGGRAPDLDELDTLFFELEYKQSLTAISAAWIAGLDCLQPTHDETVSHLLAHTARLNPHRAERLLSRQVGVFDQALREPVRLSIGLAASRCTPPEPLVAIGGGSYRTDDDVPGRAMAIQIRTVRGRRFALVWPDQAAIHEHVETGPAPAASADMDADALNAAFAEWQAAGSHLPEPGKRLSLVKQDEAAAAAAACETLRAAVAVDLLLREAGIDARKVVISVNRVVETDEIGPSLEIWVIGPEVPHKAAVSRAGAVMVELSGKQQVASVSAAQIAEHHKRAAAWA